MGSLKYLFTFNLLFALILCATVTNLHNNNHVFVILLYTPVLFNTNNSSTDLYNGDLPTMIVIYTRNFTQGWLAYHFSSSALYIVQLK